MQLILYRKPYQDAQEEQKKKKTANHEISRDMDTDGNYPMW